MKRFLLLFLLILPISANADSFAEADYNIVNGKAQADYNNIVSKGSILGKNQDKAAVLLEMESVLKDKAPDLVSHMSGKSDDEKFQRYRSKLAELAFDEYEQAFIAALKYKSKETGRELKKREHNHGCESEVFYWLDNGELDSPECDIERPDLSSKEWVDWVKEHACFYPDGHEEHWLMIQNYNTCDKAFNKEMNDRNIVAADDYKDKNVNIVYNIMLSDHTLNAVWYDEEHYAQDLFLQVIQTSVDYDKNHARRNQEVQDIRDGMYEYSGKVYPDGSIEPFKIDESKNWKSAIGPETTVRSQTNMFMSSGARYRSKNE